jgi:hypothetical protein
MGARSTPRGGGGHITAPERAEGGALGYAPTKSADHAPCLSKIAILNNQDDNPVARSSQRSFPLELRCDLDAETGTTTASTSSTRRAPEEWSSPGRVSARHDGDRPHGPRKCRRTVTQAGVDVGHQVVLSNSREPETLSDMVRRLRAVRARPRGLASRPQSRRHRRGDGPLKLAIYNKSVNERLQRDWI